MRRTSCFCGRPTAGYHKHCHKHHSANKRHGDPLQTAIRSTDLNPYIRHLNRWIAKHPEGEKIKATIIKAWASFVLDCRGERAAMTRGFAWKVEALEAVIKLDGDGVEHEKAAMTATALAYMAADDPRRFRSDRAVRFQMARRVRNLTTTHRAQAWCHSDGRRKYWYRPLTPKASDYLGQRLLETVGRYGVAIHSREMQAEQRRKDELLSTLRMINDAPITTTADS